MAVAMFLFFYFKPGDEKCSIKKNYAVLKNTAEKIFEYTDKLFITSWKAKLYFGDEKSDYLVAEHRMISSASNPENKALALINELIQGPHAKGVRTIPDRTTVKSISIDKKIAHVNFSEGLSRLHPGGSSSELMTVYSIVNTLTKNLDEVDKVKILIDGNEIETIAGHIDCREVFSANMSIVR